MRAQSKAAAAGVEERTGGEHPRRVKVLDTRSRNVLRRLRHAKTCDFINDGWREPSAFSITEFPSRRQLNNTLRALAVRGYVERMNLRDGSDQPLYRYRITDAGIAALRT